MNLSLLICCDLWLSGLVRNMALSSCMNFWLLRSYELLTEDWLTSRLWTRLEVSYEMKWLDVNWIHRFSDEMDSRSLLKWIHMKQHTFFLGMNIAWPIWSFRQGLTEYLDFYCNSWLHTKEIHDTRLHSLGIILCYFTSWHDVNLTYSWTSHNGIETRINRRKAVHDKLPRFTSCHQEYYRLITNKKLLA
jgi:hypothetical protein